MTIDSRPASPGSFVHRLRQFGRVDVVLSSVALMGTTIVTSAGGFIFWVVVARYYPAAEVGRSSALVSAITLFSSVGVFGLGTMLISELARNPDRLDPLLPAAIGLSALLSGLLAIGAATAVMVIGHSGLREALHHDWIVVALFVVAVAVTSSSLVFDQATLGLRASRLQWFRNSVMCGLRIPVVLLTGVLIGRTVDSVLASWLITLVVSMAVIVPALRRRGLRRLAFRAPVHLRGLGAVTMHHNTLNLALTVPRMAMPVVVAAYHPGTTTAVFYVAWMVASFLFLIPTHLSTSLFAVTAGDAAVLRQKVRVTVGLCVAIGLVLVPAVALFAHPILAVFGPSYVSGAGCLALLAVQYFPTVVKQHYASILRGQGQVRRAGSVCAIAAVAELATVGWTLNRGGIAEASGALAAVLFVEAVLMAPVLIRTVREIPAAAPEPHGGSAAFATAALPTDAGPRTGTIR